MILNVQATLPQQLRRSLLVLSLAVLGQACFFGGLVVRGGHSHRTDILPAASLTRGAEYQVVCTVQQLQSLPGDLKNQPGYTTLIAGLAQQGKAGASKDNSDASPSKSTPGSGTDQGSTSGTQAPTAADLAFVRLLDRQDYRGGCEREGRTSVFFLFNMIPITEPLHMERAIALAVQAVEGDSMVNLRVWHEIHYYGLVGRAAVWRVRGDVIRYRQPDS